MDPIKKEIIWQAPEFKYQPKDVSWYWLSIIVAGVLVLIALWQKNLLFGLFIIIAELVIIFWAKQFPKSIQFKIDAKGVHLGKIKFYSYEDLSGFHIIEGNDGVGELILKTKNKFHPYVKVLLVNNDIPAIKEFLKKYLEEIEYEESLSDSISKMIGF